MIETKPVQLTDKEWMDPLIKAADMRGCHQNFTNIFIWAQTYNQRVGQVGDYLIVKNGYDTEKQSYFFPAGSGDVKPVLLEMMKDAAESNHPFVLLGVSPENRAVLDTLFPDSFEYTDMRDSFDYLYTVEKLVTLAGKKLHGKRNHIARFKENNPDWSFEPITAENLPECWKMNKEWCILNGCAEDEGLSHEAAAVRLCFDHFFALGLEGGLLRAGGKVIAYTMGEPLSSDTYNTHIEKAFGNIQGAYPMINQQFAAYIQEKHPHIIYINREEDMGSEGLRKAKLSYQPDRMEEKYRARLVKPIV